MKNLGGVIKDFVSFSTIKNVSTLMTGSILSIIIPIITAPISSRIFDASDYGILGLYVAINGVINVIAYAHYQHAILLEKEEEGAKQYLWFTILFCIVIALICGVAIGILYVTTIVIETSVIGFWIVFLPLSIVCNGITSCFLLWANRIQEYKLISTNRVIQAILTVIVQIWIGILIPGEAGLLTGFILGQVISAYLLLRKYLNSQQHGVGKPPTKGFLKMGTQYKGLLFYSAPSEFINTLINQAPVFLLQRFSGIAYVGNYNFTQRLLGMPQMLLSSAIVEVFRQKAVKQYNDTGNCRPIFIKTLKILTAIAVVSFAVIFLYSPQLFEFAFGSQWREAGELARILGILFFFRFVISPLTYVYTISKRFREDLIMHILLLLVITVSFLIGSYLFDNDRFLLLIYSMSYSSFYLVYLFRSYKLSKRDNGKF